MKEILESLLEANRHQRHDFLNHLQVIWGYIKLNKKERAVEYIQELTDYLQTLRELNRIAPVPLAADISAKVLSIGLNKNFNISIPEEWEIEEKNFPLIVSFFNEFWEKLVSKAINEDKLVNIKLTKGKMVFSTEEVGPYLAIGQKIQEKYNLNLTTWDNEIVFSFGEK